MEVLLSSKMATFQKTKQIYPVKELQEVIYYKIDERNKIDFKKRTSCCS